MHDWKKYDDQEIVRAAKETAIAIHDEIRKLKGSGTSSTNDGLFSDVSASSPFAEAISWAVEKGITTGLSADIFGPGEQCNNGQFSPAATCTRGQIVTFLYRAMGK